MAPMLAFVRVPSILLRPDRDAHAQGKLHARVGQYAHGVQRVLGQPRVADDRSTEGLFLGVVGLRKCHALSL